MIKNFKNPFTVPILLMIFLLVSIINRYLPINWRLINLSWDLDKLAVIITALVSFLNLYFLYKFNKKDVKYRNKQEILDRKSYWFREVVLEQHLATIYDLDKLKSDLILIKYSHDVENEVSNIMTQFNEIKINIGKNLIDVLSIIDPKLSKNLYDKLDMFQDKCIEELDELINTSENDFNNKRDNIGVVITNFKKAFINQLYIFEMNSYETIKQLDIY